PARERRRAAVERARERDRDPIAAHSQTDRHMNRPAAAPHPVKSAGLRLIASPRVHATDVKLAVARMESTSHDAGRKLRDRQRRQPPLHLVAHPLAQHAVYLAVPIRKVQQAPLERPPAFALDSHDLTRRAVEAVRDPAHRRLHRPIRRIRYIVISPHITMKAPGSYPVDSVLW